jgi:MFS transporter, SHS family, lactate transporter
MVRLLGSEAERQFGDCNRSTQAPAGRQRCRGQSTWAARVASEWRETYAESHGRHGRLPVIRRREAHAVLEPFRVLTPAQRRAYFAALAGWSLDALDFFVFVFCLKSISGQFHTDIRAVSEGIFLTLAFRPLGALVFGWLAERYGRRPILMLNVASYTVVQLISAFAPNLATLLALRALFGFAMGGEWGVGAALALETLPAKGRGFFSGLLQEGYVIGYLLASFVYWCAFDYVGWRGMFVISAASAPLVLFIRYGVEESPAWLAGASPRRASAAAVWAAVRGYFPMLLYLVVLMACFNAFSHGSQDLYPTFLQVQHRFSTGTTGTLAIVMNIGALAGGICFGALSERLGRRRAITLAAALTLPLIPLWAFSQSAVMLALGGFLMQFMVQGAWGIVPAHLNELSPPSVRAILPGFAYQLGNLAMSKMGPFQAGIAEARGGDYAYILAWTLAVVAVALIIVTRLGPEARSAELKVSV